MTSTLTWVDFAETDRQKMLDMLHLFADHETRDELGLGSIRDAFADYFFPGTSTIQTRARYMLFIPWLFRTLEKRELTPAEYSHQARQLETSLIYALLNGGEAEKVIGQEAKGSLQRLPSAVYWAGLGSWGIRLFRGTQSRYFRYLPLFYRSQRNRLKNDENEDVDYLGENWHMGLPSEPPGLLTRTTFDLTREEADYLSEMIMYHHQETLLARLIVSGTTPQSRYFWDEPMTRWLDSSLVREIQLSRNFSEIMHGAALLYNLMLATKRAREDWITKYDNRMRAWTQLVRSRWTALSEWHKQIREFWTAQPLVSANVPMRTRRFVESWLDIVLSGVDFDAALQSAVTRSLLEEREFQLKGNRSRLLNTRALEMWSGSSGEQQLDYRWSTVAAIIADITKGLSGSNTDA